MKKKISLLTALALTAAMSTATVWADNSSMPANPDIQMKYSHSGSFKYTPKFDDVPSDWSFRYITEMSSKGVINGNGLGKFFPGNTVSKEQAVIMTVSAMGLGPQAEALGENTTLSLKDATDVDTWARPYVAIALQQGFLDADTTLDPKQPAEREWVAQLVVRALGQKTNADAHMKDTLSYKDAASVSASEVGYIAVASTEGILHGTDTGYFLPHAPVKRNQMAVILCNAEHLFEYNSDRQVQTQGQLNGTVTAVSSAGITLQTADHQTITYKFSSQYYVFLGEQMSNLSAITTGMWAHVLLNPQGEIVFLQAKPGAPQHVDIEAHAHGTVIAFTAPTATATGTITINQWSVGMPTISEESQTKQLTLPVASDAKVLLSGSAQTDFGAIKAGQNVTLNVEDNTVVCINVIPKAANPIEYPLAL